MTLLEIIERAKHWRDLTHSPRKSPYSYLADVQIAIDDIIKDRYDNFKQKKPYSFQSTQNLRDQLSNLVLKSSVITASGNIIPNASYPSNYRHFVALSVNITDSNGNSQDYWASPTTYDELRNNQIDPFHQPTIQPPSQIYYIEFVEGLEVYWGSIGVLNSAYFYYIKEPVKVSYGTSYNNTHMFTIGTGLMALTPTVYNGVNYNPFDQFSITIGVLHITSGSVVEVGSFINTDLPLMLHEEIAKRTSAIGILITENYNKKNAVDKENLLQ